MAAAALTGAGFLLGRTTSPRPAPVAVAPAPLPAATPTPEPETPSVLGRADIIALGQRAADIAASQTAAATGLTGIEGRRFDLVIPFGCAGPSPATSTDPVRWRYDADTQTLRIHVAPVFWEAGAWGVSGANAEGSMRGFWVDRPWTSSERCQRDAANIPATPVGVAPVEQTLAVAEVVPEDQRRDAHRTVRPYSIIKRMTPDSFDPARGFRLRLLGRISQLPDGQAIHCNQLNGEEQRPICLIGAMFDEIRIEQSGGTVLGTWSPRPD